jgi:beta-lactamase regulating signal transducer with metallopeptidase domain
MGLLQGVRIIRMLKLLRRALPPDPELLRHVEASGRRLGVRAVAVRVVPGIGSPVVWAVRRPLLLWPKELPAGVSEQAIRGLIVHELAHVKRRDHWVGWLELLAGCVWWWDPLFW